MNRRSALLLVHLAVVLFGAAGLFGKWIALSPASIVLGRTVFAAAALGLWLGIVERARPRFAWRMAGNGVVLALHWGSFFTAIEISSVGIGVLGYASFPLFVLILERVMLGRRLAPRDLATAALVTAGLALLVPELSLANRVVQGLLWGIVSGFTFAWLAVSNRKLARDRGATDIAFWQNAWAALALIPVVVLTGTDAMPTARDLALIAVLGVACTALAHTLFIAGLAVVSAHTASIVAALEPVYAMVFAFSLLGETPDARMIAGAALIIGAAWNATRLAPPIG